ncbi:unnamed protein product [Mesocestoides corti]|uniref:Uncharacterized protein n=1 Tax=Mesocestoides corti TaxID=53468 RepID=A0A0R3U1J3_MESCO|nr:unnamed protein product [Mesocestoides corti]
MEWGPRGHPEGRLSDCSRGERESTTQMGECACARSTRRKSKRITQTPPSLPLTITDALRDAAREGGGGGVPLTGRCGYDLLKQVLQSRE